MANFQPNYPNISWRHSTKHCDIGLIENRVSWKNSGHNVMRISKRTKTLERERGFVVKCCGSSISSSAEEVTELDGNYGSRKQQFGYLVSEYGWQVRRMVEKEDEMRKVAQVQAEAFHVPVMFFNDLFFQFFQAEVLSGLIYKLRNSLPDRYACLVAETKSDDPESQLQELVGVVDVTIMRDKDVLQHLSEVADEYVYVSGIAVLNNFRRKKVATALLRGCDMLSIVWGFKYLVLRVYEDDWGARKLYTNAGYRIISGDPPWITWIGRRRRVLMIKQV